MPFVTSEILEPRRLLAGVTLITHGFQSDGVSPQWVDRMAEAVDQRIEPGSSKMWTDASLYRMRAVGSSSSVSISQFERVAGPSPTLSRSGEAVIALDWASVSGLSGPSTALVATAVVDQLLAAGPAQGFAIKLTVLPIHLIGHSRGGSLVSEIARQLGQRGIWVDHLTTLDAFPIGSDPAANVTDNVFFADNFYENTDFIVHGSPVSGAQNVGPLNLPGGAGLAHSDVHTFYHGSIDRGATGDGDVTLNPSWYGTTLGRAMTGFDWSRLSGAARPAAGLGIAGGGSASRVHVDPTLSATPWPNLSLTSITGGTNGVFNIGDTFTLNFRYQTHTISGEIDVYLDTDTNLFNGFNRVFVIGANLPQTGAKPNTVAATASANWTSAPLTPGVYYINGIITDGTSGHQRTASLSQPVLVTANGMELITKRWADDTDSHAWSEPRNWSPGAPPTSTDRALLHFGQANLSTNAAVRSLDMTNDATLTVTAPQRIGSIALFGNSRMSMGAGGSNLLIMTNLTLGATADLDLTDNDLLIDYDTASPLAAVQASINAARAGGLWTGHGLTSSAARDATLRIRTLAAMEAADYRSISKANTTFGGEPIDLSAVLVKFTYYGDTNFDNRVNFDDYTRIDGGFNNNRTGWLNGDFNGDGRVNFDDYTLIDGAFNSIASPPRIGLGRFGASTL